MKWIKHFESITGDIESDCEIAHGIFSKELYLTFSEFLDEWSKIVNSDIKFGVLLTLVVKGDDFGITGEMFSDLLHEFSKADIFNEDESYDNYISFMTGSVRSRLFDFFTESEDLSTDQDFIDFIKSLSQSNLELVNEICIENEVYEVVIFINSIT